MNKWIFCTLSALVLSGCSIVREVSSIDEALDERVCIIENAETRDGFLTAYQTTLHQMGYKPKVLPPFSSLDSCKVVSTYVGRWSWDLAIYMSYAQIDVYTNEQLAGSALYDSTRGAGSMDKFIDAEDTISGLVQELYPPMTN